MILIFSLLLFYSADHDVAKAEFKIFQSEGKLLLEITCDVEDLAKEMKRDEKDLSIILLESYIIANTSFVFDNKENQVQVKGFKKIGDHLKISCIFKDNPDKITLLEINNNCLLSVKNHSNIIELDLNGKSRDFRMHKRRTSIKVKY